MSPVGLGKSATLRRLTTIRGTRKKATRKAISGMARSAQRLTLLGLPLLVGILEQLGVVDDPGVVEVGRIGVGVRNAEIGDLGRVRRGGLVGRPVRGVFRRCRVVLLADRPG